MKSFITKLNFAIFITGVAALFLGSCAGPYSIGYPIDPLETSQIKYATPVLVRNFADRRPVNERFYDDQNEHYDFFSLDKDFVDPVDKSITKAFQIELANAGFEVADAGNFIIGEKPYIRIAGDILHFYVSRKELPLNTIKQGEKTLWRKNQYTVRVTIRIKVIDAKSRKLVMKRTYTSSDTFTLRSEMIDVKAYTEGKPIEKSKWQVAGDDYSIQLLNKNLKNVLVQARKDIVKLLSPVDLKFTE